MRRLNLFGLGLLCALLVTLPLPTTDARQGQAAATSSAPFSAATFTAAREAAGRITAAHLKEYLYYIASDAMAGRDTPSPGLDATARFIAGKLGRIGFTPAGDNGTFFQHIPLERTEIDHARTHAELAGHTYKVGVDFFPVSGSGSGELEGQLVYVGHGWLIRSQRVNAYEGLDVRDKIMIVAGDATTPPPGVSYRDLKAGDWETPVSYARAHGARAIIFVPRNYARAWRHAFYASSRVGYHVLPLEPGAARGGIGISAGQLPMIMPSEGMLDALFAGERLAGAQMLQASVGGQPGTGFALSPDKRLRLSIQLKNTPAQTQNVVAVLEGRDPQLKQEYVALGAHYDHVGVGRPVNGDAIYNGADDDGSGTTALLAMAEAFARGPRLRRSLLFVWHCGEEKGLWGSEYFTEFPTVPLEQVVAQLNIDMIGRSKKPGDTNPKNEMLTGPEEIYVIGSRMMSDELGNLNEQVNRSYLNLKYNYHYDEPNDPEQLFYRSDHYNYARKGIPIIFFFDGVHEDYHQPSDSPDKIDYEKMLKVTRTVFILAAELADAPRRPVIERPLPADRLDH